MQGSFDSHPKGVEAHTLRSFPETQRSCTIGEELHIKLVGREGAGSSGEGPMALPAPDSRERMSSVSRLLISAEQAESHS